MKSVNLPPERRPTLPYQPLTLIEEAASLRRTGKRLRAKSEELRKRNVRVVRAADAAARRGFLVSFEIFEATMEMRFVLDTL